MYDNVEVWYRTWECGSHDHDGFYTLLIPKAIDTWLLPYQGLARIMR
ncbi:hypothetical protein BIFPSEUDO_03465 [Bifidobacterium pseudocatenulatum DSM 20438 = JCM 1200 = LMG 10505]|uniref:Uncharacterized protein n=1 Tax=Bifidobacterium pseudocatenulatum DSM 20438 = JCM 1200 = LMG 10505 TaxID=547043 RepID=C0BSU8_BIFPS|nr:hypothetical protein BIFPSEUDO_03465 [Bifidobacterium pseudocatenulatum DSM 20438 = JCM 1200 = LMG 10505]